MQLLSMAVEQEVAAIDPLRQPAPERKGPFPPGSLGYDQEQLSPPDSHYTWPFGHSQIFDFGDA